MKCPECGSEHDSERIMLIHHSKAHPNKWKQRFWMRVDKGGEDECWEWTGAYSAGYGQMMIDGEKVGSHRISLMIDGVDVGEEHALHTCDNKSCVNPDHIYLGDPKDNMDDAKERGQYESNKGEDHGQSKLTESEVLEIRKRCDQGETLTSIAEDYPVSRSQISNIGNRKKWPHL